MRRPPWRLVLLCLACGFCSLLYAISQRGSGSTEVQEPAAASSVWWRGAAEERHRCKDFSVSFWNPYWMLPPGVCGKDCFWEAALRYTLLKKQELDLGPMHLAVVACGDRLEETVTMLKSAVLFSIKPLEFHIFAEDQLHKDFSTILNTWGFPARFKYTVYPISFPSENAAEWRKLFKPCASQRLFLPNDMTTVRLHWGEILMPLLKKYKLNITWGDQDLLNIIFSHNPESLYVFPCQWNYRPDHCIYGSNCNEAEDGIFILHGNRGVYHDNKQPAFRAVYEALRNFSFGDDLIHSLLHPLELELQKTEHTYCGRIHKLFTKQLTKSIDDFSTRQLNVR
ncbi:glucoside xylosyltransferase 1 isoform X3 [Ranitomeya imitator]|uniref:glucoside xylosyltransferase 1 isoform X3 n=1 Tax=Ranitomeya imitator TaxID=111125 RepID=UPI0037E7F925